MKMSPITEDVFNYLSEVTPPTSYEKTATHLGLTPMELRPHVQILELLSIIELEERNGAVYILHSGFYQKARRATSLQSYIDHRTGDTRRVNFFLVIIFLLALFAFVMAMMTYLGN